MYAVMIYALIQIVFGIFIMVRVRKFGMLSKPLLWITIGILAFSLIAMVIGQAATITSVILPIYKLTNTINEPSSTVQTTPTPIDETANWKTYTNSKFGYSFQYPPTLSVSNCPSNDCGEILYYPKAPGKVEIDEDNTLVDISLIGGKYCQYENKFKDGANPKRASLQAQCDLPGVSQAGDPILPVIDEQTTNTSSGLSQYSFYLQGYQNNKIGPFYAFFLSKPVAEMNINKDLATYYGVYWTPNRFKPLTSDKMSVFDQILSTFKFTR